MHVLRFVFTAQLSGLAAAISQQASFLKLKPNIAQNNKGSKPHIMFILLDDLGWSEAGFNKEASVDMLPTPHMDALAGDGVVLKRHYVHKYCSPTRSAIQSGRSPIHVNVNNAHVESHNPEDPVGGFAGIPRNMTGIAAVLKRSGYKTHMVGKWDIGVATADHLPVGRGYDTSLIYFEHTNDNWKFKSNVDCGHLKDLWEHDETIPFPGRPALGLMNEEGCSFENQSEGCVYEDTLFENRVTQILNEHDPADPLFLFWATHAVHGPYQPPTKFLDYAKHFANNNNSYQMWFRTRAPYYAALAFIDGAIGRVIALTKDKGMYDNMLIVLSSDNGGVAGMSNEPLRGAKFTNFEGGIRAVSCVSGGFIPEKVRGSTQDGLIGAQDWYATFAHLAGADHTDHRAAAAKLPAVDSINIWPLISGATDVSPRAALSIGTTVGGYSSLARRTGAPAIGGLIRRLAGTHYKLLLGDKEGAVECDMVFGPGDRADEHPDGFNPNDDCPKVTRACGLTPETGCLFDINADPSEANNLAKKFPAVFYQLLGESREESETVFKPRRGDVIKQDCATMEEHHAEFLGPFLFE